MKNNSTFITHNSSPAAGATITENLKSLGYGR